MAIRVSIFMVLLLGLSFTQEPYRKVLPNQNAQAVCLDGSPSALYIHQGSEEGKFLIFFYGGGICMGYTEERTLENCLMRSRTFLGSSTLMPEEIIGQGYLSTDPEHSRFANWTKILLPYCDGSLHQGYKKQPVVYNGTKLYFKGNLIVRSHFDWIKQKYNLENAKNIVLAGTSAGGVALMSWSNYIQRLIQGPEFVNILDSTNFINSTDPQGETTVEKLFLMEDKWLFQEQKLPFQECAQAHPGQKYKCLFLFVAYPFLKGRTLIIDSQYDAWQVQYFIKQNCFSKNFPNLHFDNCNETEMNIIHDLRDKKIQHLMEYVKDTRTSVWSNACASHVHANKKEHYNNETQRTLMDSDTSFLRAAVEQFALHGSRIVNIDFVQWPNNYFCAY